MNKQWCMIAHVLVHPVLYVELIGVLNGGTVVLDVGTIPNSHNDTVSGNYDRPSTNVNAVVGEVTMYVLYVYIYLTLYIISLKICATKK